MKAEFTNYLAYFIWNVLDMCIIIRYMDRLYGKVKKHWNIYSVIVTLIILFTTSSMNPGDNYLNLVAITCMSFILLIFYPQNAQKEILFSAILLAIAGFWSVASYFIICVLSTIEIPIDFLTVYICHLGFWILLELAPHLSKSAQRTIPYRLWYLLLSIPVASIGAFWCIILMASKSNLPYKQADALGIPILLILLFINLMVFFLFDRFSTLVNATSENILLLQHVEFQEQHYQQLEFVHNRIRSIRHDMKNSLQMACYLLENGKTQELKEYLGSLTSSINSVEKVVSTLNPALDSVLNIKIAEMKEYHIEIFSDIVIPQGLKITFEQSIILIGNIMDNAKEACILLPEKERWIRLKISYISQILFISLQNSIIKSQEQANGILVSLVSKKKDHLFHGLGLKNVKRMVDEFHGTMTTEFKDNKFRIKIILYDA
jgi:hypothetical protein